MESNQVLGHRFLRRGQCVTLPELPLMYIDMEIPKRTLVAWPL